MVACTVSQKHKKLLSEMTLQGKSGEERLRLSFMRTMEEDIGWAGGESLHFDFFKRETSFTLEYESGSKGRRERKRCCL